MGENSERLFTVITKIIALDNEENREIEIIICIPGNYPDLSLITILDHSLYFFEKINGIYQPIQNKKLKEALLFTITMYHFACEAEIITSNFQPFRENIEGLYVERLATDTKYGEISVSWSGAVEYSGKLYQFATANPKKHVYLLIILEVISEDPYQFRGIDIANQNLVNGIVQTYLEKIGAIPPEETDTDNENDDYC